MDKTTRILCLSPNPLQKTPGRILRRWHNRRISPPKSREYARFCPRALARTAAPMRYRVASHPSAAVVRKTGRTAAPPRRCADAIPHRSAATLPVGPRKSRCVNVSQPSEAQPTRAKKKHRAPFKTRAAGKPRSSHPPILAHHSQFHSLSLATRRLALGPPLHDTGAHAAASRGPSLQRAAFITARMRLGSFAWRLPKETPAHLRKDPRCDGPAQPRQPP